MPPGKYAQGDVQLVNRTAFTTGKLRISEPYFYASLASPCIFVAGATLAPEYRPRAPRSFPTRVRPLGQHRLAGLPPR